MDDLIGASVANDSPPFYESSNVALLPRVSRNWVRKLVVKLELDLKKNRILLHNQRNCMMLCCLYLYFHVKSKFRT